MTNLNRDFVIRRVDDAKAREAPKTKKPTAAKRKVKSEPTSKKAKKKKRVEEEDESGS